MVALVNSRRKELAEQWAQERKDRHMTPAQLRQYMRTYVKNQGPVVYTTSWTMAQVRKLSPEQLQEEFDKIQIAEVEGEAPSQDVSREEVDAPSHSQNIPEAQVEVPSQEATVEDVPKAQQTASSLKKVGTKKKLLGRKGVHTSHSTIPIEEGDPDAEHKLCIKYASDEDSASDCDTPVHLYAVVDWELLPTGLGSINAIYRLDNSRKYFTSLREILHLVTRADLMTIYGRVMTFYQDKKAEGVGLVLWGDLKILMDSPKVNDGSDFWKNQHTWSIQNWKLYSFSGVHVLETVSGLVIHMFVDKKYPLTINLIERMLDHQLEICHGTVGNELTTAVQLIAFLKKQISDSKRPKVHEWVINSPCSHNKELASPEQTATDRSKFHVYVKTQQMDVGCKVPYDQSQGLVSNFMASQDARLSKFEADFKQITKSGDDQTKCDTVFCLLILTQLEDPQCSTQIHSLINTITMYPKKPYEPHGHDTITEVKKDEEPKDTPQKGLKGPTIINELESNRIKEEKEFGWLDIEDPLDLVDTCKESVYESLIKEIPSFANFQILGS
ncbi:hypothetical protein Tco_0764229 [Tanacetum coccineum]